MCQSLSSTNRFQELRECTFRPDTSRQGAFLEFAEMDFVDFPPGFKGNRSLETNMFFAFLPRGLNYANGGVQGRNPPTCSSAYYCKPLYGTLSQLGFWSLFCLLQPSLRRLAASKAMGGMGVSFFGLEAPCGRFLRGNHKEHHIICFPSVLFGGEGGESHLKSHPVWVLEV